MSMLTTLLFTVTATLSSSATAAIEQTEATDKLCPNNSCEQQIKRLKRYGALYKDPGALILLATAYMTGEGVEKDPRRAYQLIKRAARAGSTKAYFILSAMQRDGIGTEVNLKRSQLNLDRSAKYGYAPAMFQKSLETLDFSSSDNAKAIQWLEKAVAGRSREAIYLMAQLRETGTVVAKDLLGAAELYKQAAFWQYKDSGQRLQHIADSLSKETEDYSKVAKLLEEVETITIHGSKVEFHAALDMKIDAIIENSHFDGRSGPFGCTPRNGCSFLYRASDNKHGTVGLQHLGVIGRGQ